MRLFGWWLCLVSVSLSSSCPLFAEEGASGSSVNHLFRDQFYLSASEKIRHNTTPASGFLLIEKPNTEWNSKVTIVSGFAPGGRALRTQALKDIQSLEEAREWLKNKKKEISFEDVPVVELSIPLPDGGVVQRYWVGNKSFSSFDEASAEIAMVQSLIQMQGGDFNQALAIAQQYQEPETEALPSAPVKTKAQFEKEEELMLRWVDQMNIGESLYGPLEGVPVGEQILYQSFGETSWRSTNLAENSYRSQVGFWTNRLVFKGIRFPFSTLDPYVEVTVAGEATGNDGGNQLDAVAGLEWRPLARVAWLENFQPGGIALLKFIKNYRFSVAYYNRRNLKDEIANIRDFDLRFGLDIFYEWGIDLPPLDQAKGTGFAGFLGEYTWGEYFGDYRWRDTNFTGEEDFDAWIFDTSLTLGVKVPLVKLPPNPVNERLMLMPYLRLGLIYNTKLSNPSDNRYFVATGLRWMPFRDYRFANNEWLFKTKIFAEWLGIGKVQNFKQDDSTPMPDEDWRIGIAWSLRRF